MIHRWGQNGRLGLTENVKDWKCQDPEVKYDQVEVDEQLLQEKEMQV